MLKWLILIIRLLSFKTLESFILKRLWRNQNCFDSHLFPLIHKTADSHSYFLSCRNNLTAIFIRTSRGKLQLPQCFAKCQAILVSISVLKASVGNKWSLKKREKINKQAQICSYVSLTTITCPLWRVFFLYNKPFRSQIRFPGRFAAQLSLCISKNGPTFTVPIRTS